MYILYVFRFKNTNKNILNNIKRRFYYNYNKLNKIIKLKLFKKQQIFLIDQKNKEIIDDFMKEFLPWIEYYELKIGHIEFITENQK
ncbi:MAG: hypothetical protein N3G74_00515 [Candidatus Micrarchaeota archaeon]|nr:hypothetical protein [Candidatus Micrarchaeota archaeon]